MEYHRREGEPLVGTFWCPGVIEKVSTASTRIRSTRPGPGWLLIKFDDCTHDWLLANRPSFWRAKKPGAWRFENDDGRTADADVDSDLDENELVDAADDEDDGNDDDDIDDDDF